MKKVSQTLIVIILFFFSFKSFSQIAEYEWWDEMCDCKSTFDSTKYSREQLDNTFKYLWWMQRIETDATAWELDEIAELNVDTLKKECELSIERLLTYDFALNEFWESHKQNLIKYLESTCELSRLTILGYSNPDTLKYFETADDTCNFYSNALIKGNVILLDAWLSWHRAKMIQNGNPESWERKFLLKFNSPYAIEYARLELMQFGWWNSANHTLPHIEQSINFSKEFEKLFIETDCECDIP